MKSEEPLTFRQAACAIGWGNSEAAAVRLRRVVRSFEARTGRSVAFALNPDTRRPKHKLTLSRLFVCIPDLAKQKVDRVADEVRHMLDTTVEQRIGEALASKVEPRLKELWDRDLALEERLDALKEERM